MVCVRLTGHRVIDQQAVQRPPPARGAKNGEKPTGPLWIEGLGRRLIYRNIRVLERP
jgi:hypothetical protein